MTTRTALLALSRPALLVAASEATRILDRAFPGRVGATAPLLDATLPRSVLVERVLLARLAA